METTTTGHSSQKEYTDPQKHLLIQSMCALLLNKVKLLLKNPKKNQKIAANEGLFSLIELLADHIIPQYCVLNYKSSQKLATMHSLCFLLASKVQAVFNSGVIRTCIDQNWDMKGYKSVLLRILQEIGMAADDYKKLQEFFDKTIQSQNLQSQACIKAISYFLRSKKNATIEEDDLRNPVASFQTTFEFVKSEIEKFRNQNMSPNCFSVLHPWAYDLDLVDFKYVINRDQTFKITEALTTSKEAQVVWLSYFKAQVSASADEFFSALKEIAVMGKNLEYFETQYTKSYKKFMIKNNYVVSLVGHADKICKYINDLVKNLKVDVVNNFINLRQDARPKIDYIDEAKIPKTYKISAKPDLSSLEPYLPNSTSVTLGDDQIKNVLDLRRYIFKVKPTKHQPHNLYLRFTNVDTEELKDLEIKFDGNLGQFKVGEGDCNHYVITNDKKLWESQFMILNLNGKYYIRDLGIVHTSRIKVNSQTSLQIHQGALLDLGKVVHYHVDKLLHEQTPTRDSNGNYIVMRTTQANYKLDDEAILRARPTWISADENKDLVQNEILLEPNDKKASFSIGRSNRRDVEIKLKAVSADHCKIEYQQELGWFIHEREKDKLSSNGTFVFMKSLQQMDDHEPSDLIPLFNGMTVSFINYELQVRIEPKSSDEIAKSQHEDLDLNEEKTEKAKPQAKEQHTVQKAPQQEIKQHHQEEAVHHNQHASNASLHQKHTDPYNEKLQATHQQKSKPEFHEEQKQHHQHSPSKHSLHQQEDEDEHEEVKSKHSHKVSNQSHRDQKSVADLHEDSVHEDQHSGLGKGSINDQHSVHDHYEDNQQDDRSVNQSIHKDPSQKSVRQSQIHSVNQSIHKDPSQKSVRQSEPHSVNQSIHKDPSQKSVRQSEHHQVNQSIHSLQSKNDHQEPPYDSGVQSHHSVQSQHQQDDDEVRKSVQSVHSVKSQHPAQSSHHEVNQSQASLASKHHTQQDHNHNNAIHHDNQVDDDSPKQKSKASFHADEDEQHQEMMRSYSQHHIGEAQNDNQSHRQSKQQLIHSDDEEQEAVDIYHNDENDNQREEDQEDQRFSVHHDMDNQSDAHKSVRGSQASVRGKQQQDEEEHQKSVHSIHQKSVQSVYDSTPVQQQNQNEEIKSQKSVKSLHNQSIHQESSHGQTNQFNTNPNNQSSQSLHESHHYTDHGEEQKHNQSQHSLKENSVHQPHPQSSHHEHQHSIHNQSVHDEELKHNESIHHETPSHHQSVHHEDHSQHQSVQHQDHSQHQSVQQQEDHSHHQSAHQEHNTHHQSVHEIDHSHHQSVNQEDHSHHSQHQNQHDQDQHQTAGHDAGNQGNEHGGGVAHYDEE